MSEVKNSVREAQVLAEVLPVHVMRLANTNMGMSMMDWDEISNDILAAAQILAALSHPAPDVPGAEEVEAIRARHEADEQAAEEGDGVPPLRLIAAYIDRGDLLRLLDAARAELAEERAKVAVIDEALTMACDERDEAYDHIDKIKEAASPFTWYLSSSVFDALPSDHVPQTDVDVARRKPTLGDLRRLAAALAKDAPT